MKMHAGAIVTPVIELRGVTREFSSPRGAMPVLRDINLKIHRREFVAIVGKSGSGKSTLLNMITGIDYPSSGEVLINSREISGMGEAGLAKWRGENIGIVFQFFQLIPTLTIKENLLLAMDFVGRIPGYRQYPRAEELLELVGIAEHGDRLPAELSGGEQQRAAIARALANDPPILVADEPTGNLDSRTTEAIHGLFGSLAGRGKTVIVVTHEDVTHLEYNRVISLHDGAIAGDTRKRRISRATGPLSALPL